MLIPSTRSPTDCRRLRNWRGKKRFTVALCSKGATGVWMNVVAQFRFLPSPHAALTWRNTRNIGKVTKVKLSLNSIMHHTIHTKKTYGGVVISLHHSWSRHICRWVVSFTPRFISQGAQWDKSKGKVVLNLIKHHTVKTWKEWRYRFKSTEYHR